MSQVFVLDWTGANGTPWTDVGFERVVGVGTAVADVQGNVGEAGSTALERVYRATAYPQLPSYLAAIDLVWKNATGAGRVAGIVFRCDADGRLYCFELDSNVGSPRVRLRKRVGGSWSDVVSWQAASVAASALNAGVTLTVKVTSDDGDTNTIVCSIDGTAEISTTDGSILNGGTVGVYIGGNCTNDDVTFDNLQVQDLETESPSTPGPYTSGTVLVIDGFYYLESEWKALGLSIGKVTSSYTTAIAAELSDQERFDSGALSPGQWVKIIQDGTVLAAGRVRQTTHALTPGNGNQYQLISPKQLAAEVLIHNPYDDSAAITFNASDDSIQLIPDLQGKELGEAIAAVIDYHLEGDGGLRDKGAAPASGAAYIQSELDALTAVLPDRVATGDIVRAIEYLLSHTARGVWIDPDTRQWHFRDRTALSYATLDLASHHVTGDLALTPGQAHTAVVIRGPRPQAEVVTKSFANAEVIAKWNSSLEATWSIMLSEKNQDQGEVSAAGTDGGNGYIDPDLTGDFSMVANEWNATEITFIDGDEAGESYRVGTNTGSRIPVTEAWRNGGPANGDSFQLRGDTSRHGRQNGYAETYRVFGFADPDLTIDPDACVTIRMGQGTDLFEVSGRVLQPDDPDDPTLIVTDRPAIGLINYLPDAPCKEGVDVSTDPPEVEIEAPIYDRSLKRVPYLRVPTSGWRGTAWSADASKYDGAGEAGFGDPGVEKELPLYEPSFNGVDDVADFTELADEVLKVTGTLPRAGQLVIHGELDESWADLDWRLQVTSPTGSTDLATATDILPLAVVYDYQAKTTTLHVGTLQSGQFDLALMRRAAGLGTKEDIQKTWNDVMARWAECARDVVKAGGTVSRPDPGPICAMKVMSPPNKGTGKPGNNPGGPVNIQIDIVVEILFMIFEAIFAKQKGITGGELDDDGNFNFNGPDGQAWRITPEGDLETDDGAGGWTDGDPDDILPDGADPSDPDGAGMPGWYGQIWDVLLGLAANLGKTIVLDDTDTHGGGVPTVKVGKPGSAVGEGGGTYIPPCTEGDDPVGEPLGPTDTVPGTATTQDHAVKNSLGLDPYDLHDPGGEVWEDQNGDLFRPEPTTAGTYTDGASWERVEAVTAGTGKNGGDYDTHSTQKDFVPKQANQLEDGTNTVTAAQAKSAYDHLSDSDPHTQYQKESEKDAASGYPGLDASSRLTVDEIVEKTTDNGVTVEGVDLRDGDVTADGDVDVTGVFKVTGVQVVGAQQSAIANATDEASAITQLNAALAALRSHGLIAT